MPMRSCWLMPPRGPSSVPSPLPIPKFLGSRLRPGRSTLLKRAACQYPPGRVTCVLPLWRATCTSGPLRCSCRRCGMSSQPTQRVLSPLTDMASSRRAEASRSKAAAASKKPESPVLPVSLLSPSRLDSSVRGARTSGALSPTSSASSVTSNPPSTSASYPPAASRTVSSLEGNSKSSVAEEDADARPRSICSSRERCRSSAEAGDGASASSPPPLSGPGAGVSAASNASENAADGISPSIMSASSLGARK
mmetsp:Transcript_30979/g.77059  ORF Transcript_30979/g.77059 Transcript_30979/m.77059 type:complete len:251 (-) Transcript_30979:338-1090(-)